MDSLLAALAEKGIKLQGVSDEEIVKVAKGVGIEPLDHLPRKVEIIDYTNKRGETNKFVTTPPFIVGRKDNGLASTVRGLFVRVDCLDQMIEDLQAARELLKK